MKKTGRKRIFFGMIVTLLVVVEISSVYLMFKSVQNKETNLYDVKLKELIKKDESIAIMIEQSDGTYSVSDSEEWPSDMKYNSELSGCLDNSGNKLTDVLTFDSDNNKAIINTGETSLCYLYFDFHNGISKYCENGDNLGSCLTTNRTKIKALSDEEEGGIYRYQGTNEIAYNYICFGTTNKEECINNTDAYMYRIMGIDSEGQVKLIKKEALNEEMNWWTDYTTDIKWPESLIYQNLNGESFLTNSTYMSNGWDEKIVNYNWIYGDAENYYFQHKPLTTIYETYEAWEDLVEAKVGLMYLHDYYYGLSGGNVCNTTGPYETCKTSWIHLSNNEDEPSSTPEWVNVRAYVVEDTSAAYPYYALARINLEGHVQWNGVQLTRLVRPVFYLKADELYVSGDGTIDDPIILEGPPICDSDTNIGECLKANPTSGLNETMEGGLYRYQGTNEEVDNYICFGTSDKKECLNNTDAYMYRIIGIDENNKVKLIKKEALNEKMQWWTDNTTDIPWPNSLIYQNINGNKFLTNPTYVPDSWQDKIETINWKHGYNKNSNITASELYAIENAWTTTESSKIGLMYLHDYYYAYQSGGLDCSYSAGNDESCKSSWIHLSNNDGEAPSKNERVMSNYGYYNESDFTGYIAWYINHNGHVNHQSMLELHSQRPTFYLNDTVKYIKGDGSINNPFTIN